MFYDVCSVVFFYLTITNYFTNFILFFTFHDIYIYMMFA
jgi:hypothetical protein